MLLYFLVYSSESITFFSIKSEMGHFQDLCQEFNLKALSNTRWECRVNSVRAVRYQTSGIYDALIEVAENCTLPLTHSEALSLANELRQYSFVVATVFWYEVLKHVNVAGKMLQNKECDLSIAIDIIENLISWVKKYSIRICTH